MSLRLRLIVAFFLLSVVPLAAVTIYTYTNNVRALREAAEREADLLAGELSQRMQLVTAQLRERVEHLMDIAELQAVADEAAQQAAQIADTQAAAPAPPPELSDQIAESLGEAAMLLNNVELQGLRSLRRRSAPRAGSTRGQDDSRTAQGRPPPPPPPPGSDTPPPPAPPEPPDKLTIDMAPIRREVLRQLVPPGKLDSLTPEERQRLAAEINQRMIGVVQGIRVGAAELQKRAEEAQRIAAERAKALEEQKAAQKPQSAAPLTRRTSLTGSRLGVRVERNGEVVRELQAELNLPNVVATAFSTTRRDGGEVPFAVDRSGRIYTRTDEDRARVESFGAVATPDGPDTARLPNWIVVTTVDPSGSGLKLGIARPVGDSLASLRRAAARNAGFGLLFIGIALVGIVPLSGHLTRNLTRLNDGVRRIASGDFSVRVPVKGRDEVARLTAAFNQMAADVERHERVVVEQERVRRELELGRQIQNEMLPHGPLKAGPIEVAGSSVPAREVGGDFFNYFVLRDGRIALLIGDVSGKGVGAALLMANVQAALRTRLAVGQDLATLADEIDREIEAGTPGAVYVTLCVATLDPASGRVDYVNAGHHPPYVRRVDGRLERLDATGLPVGLFAGRGYVQGSVRLDAGDLLFFYTDGCVETENERGEMFGAERLEAALAAAPGSAGELLSRVEAVVGTFRGARELFDDATMMAVFMDPRTSRLRSP